MKQGCTRKSWLESKKSDQTWLLGRTGNFSALNSVFEKEIVVKIEFFLAFWEVKKWKQLFLRKKKHLSLHSEGK